MKPFTWQTLTYLALMVVVTVGADLLFFRHDVVLRLVGNIGIVLVFLAAYVFIFKPFK